MSWQSEVLADNPGGFWRMKETSGTTATDATGHGNNGVYVGGCTLNQTGAIASDATSRTVGFNGVDGGNWASFDLGSGDLTVEGWFWINSTAGSPCGLWAGANGATNLRVDGTTVNFYADTGLGPSAWASAWPGTNQYVHVVLERKNVGTFSQPEDTLWINNVNKGTVTGAAPWVSGGPGELIVGGANQMPLAGRAGDAAAYVGVLLSSTRIAAHYNAALAASTNAPAGNAPVGLTAWTPSPKVMARAGVATVSGSALNAVANTGNNVHANAGVALATVNAYVPSVATSGAGVHNNAWFGFRSSMYVTSGGSLPNPDFGRDVLVWARKQVGTDTASGVLYLPPNDPGSPYYVSGKIGDLLGTAYEHPFNSSLPRNGWLVLAEFIPGTVTIDLGLTGGGRFAVSDLNHGGGFGHNDYYGEDAYGGAGQWGNGFGRYRLCFDGPKFINGAVSVTGGQLLYFWYTDHSYLPDQWRTDFDAVTLAMGKTLAGSSIPNTTYYQDVFFSPFFKRNNNPTGLRLQNLGSTRPWDSTTVPHAGAPSQHVRGFGMGIGPVTDDGVFHGSGLDHEFWGSIIHAVGQNADGGTSVDNGLYGPGPAAWCHNDGSQQIGAEQRTHFFDSCILAHGEWVTENPGSIGDLRLTGSPAVPGFPGSGHYGGLWQGGWGSMSSLDRTNPGNNISGVIGSGSNANDDFYFFGNGWNQSMTDGTGGGFSGSTAEYSNLNPFYPLYNSLGFTLAAHFTRLDLATMGWSVVAGTHGIKAADYSQIINDSRNPAQRWRAAWPRSTRDAFIGAMGLWL